MSLVPLQCRLINFSCFIISAKHDKLIKTEDSNNFYFDYLLSEIAVQFIAW